MSPAAHRLRFGLGLDERDQLAWLTPLRRHTSLYTHIGTQAFEGVAQLICKCRYGDAIAKDDTVVYGNEPDGSNLGGIPAFETNLRGLGEVTFGRDLP
jgi:hypothetical protein